MPDTYVDTDIQSLVFTGFGTLPHATLIRVAGISPKWLAMVGSQVAFGRHKRDFAIQLLLTSVGLRRLGASENELEPLGREYLAGASSLPSRFRLGDPRPEDDDMEWSDRGHEAALIVYGRTAEEIRLRASHLLDNLTEVAREELRLPQNGREFFGFRDGISNITLKKNVEAEVDQVPDGEILLGYCNQDGDTFDPGPLGLNGSFVAVRQLRQDVNLFWSYWKWAAGGDCDEAILLASKSVGRWPNGMPIKPGQTTQPVYDSTALGIRSFADDALGQGCPFGAHIRRANPRDTLVEPAGVSMEISSLHRTLRRGRLFGPDAPASFYPAALQSEMPQGDESGALTARGLVFIGLCGNLRRQFEFVYQNWFNFPKHAGLFQEVDPLLHRRGMPDTFSVPTKSFNLYFRNIGQWIHPTGGAYYLLPSRHVLDRLCGMSPST